LLSIVATAGSLDVHIAWLVPSAIVLPSEKVPVTVNCCVVPSAIEPLLGLIVRAVTVTGETVNPGVVAVIPPKVAEI
jgi:hypothetical protein